MIKHGGSSGFFSKDLIRNSYEVLDGFTRKDVIGQEGKLRTEHISQVKWS